MQPQQRMVLYVVVNLAQKSNSEENYHTLKFREKSGRQQFLKRFIFSVTFSLRSPLETKDIPPNSCTAPLAAETIPHMIMHPARYQLGRRIPKSILLGTGFSR